VAAAGLTLVGLLAFSVPALGADPRPVPKPDPPPKANPPAPPPAPAPVAPAPVAPAPVALAPSVVHPTAAERRAAAEQRAAAKRRAKRKAARAARAAAAKKLGAAHRSERANDVLAAGSPGSSSSSGLPFLLATFSLALVLLGLALTPAWAVRWRRGGRALEEHREELGVMGATGVVATAVFFLLIEVTK
jgi:hypothetical protein